MKIRNIFAIFIAALLVTSCGNDDIPEVSKAFSLSVPVELFTSNTLADGTRVTGDPGFDDELQPPTCLYVFAWMQSAASSYELVYSGKTALTADDWSYMLGTNSEDKSSRYKLKNNITLNFNSSVTAQPNGTQVGKIYAVASSKPLTDGQLQSITTAAYKSVLTSSQAVAFDTSPDNTLKAASLSFADWTSSDLRDLYSNPINDTATDAYGTGNGNVVFDSSSGGGVRCGEIRLYHCAAKIDYTWEVPAEMRAETSISSIKVTGLPTDCKIFEPTANPASPVTTHTITTAVDSKWIGREYFYALQPKTGAITYDVDFAGSRTDIAGRVFAPASVNKTFTGWYRVIAKLTNP